MGIPAQSRWWVFTLLVIGILLVISLLALDRPDVIWAGESPECPHCRHEVRLYSHRCADCGGEFDWAAPSEEESPLSSMSLSVQEAEWVRDRVRDLTPEVAAQRIAAATGLSLESAEDYLAEVGRGDCGWCGGTRRALDAEPDAEDDSCPACFGSGNCIACGGDRRVRIGDARAARALQAYKRELADLLLSRVPETTKRAEAQRLAREFIKAHEGSREASQILFVGEGDPESIVTVSRRRLDEVLDALKPDDG